jgi:LmbE family N-acetylglucosaminyl deacetylase
VNQRFGNTVLVLSPHLDDAALSVGGVIADLVTTGVRVVVGVLFDGGPVGELSAAARKFHAQCGHDDDAMTHRSEEDRAALGVLGVERVRAALPEALYRRTALGEVMYPSRDAIFGPVSPDETVAVPGVVRRWVRETGCDTVLAPAAVGGHVDHVLVSSAARRLRERVEVVLYEDMPYPMLGASLPDDLGPPDHRTVSPRSWAAKLTAVSHYRSQLSVLFHDTTTWRQSLTDRCRNSSGEVGERLWWLPRAAAATNRK